MNLRFIWMYACVTEMNWVDCKKLCSQTLVSWVLSILYRNSHDFIIAKQCVSLYQIVYADNQKFTISCDQFSQCNNVFFIIIFWTNYENRILWKCKQNVSILKMSVLFLDNWIIIELLHGYIISFIMNLVIFTRAAFHL